jgi:four helix bundle protein
MGMLEGVKKIRAWELADKFAVAIYRATSRFPKEETYSLTSQMRRAAVSVPANIAEGCQRQYLKEYVQFLYQARSSLTEVEYYLHLSQNLGYLSAEQLADLAILEDETAKTLNGLIGWLERKMQTGITSKKELKLAGSG